jgi:hypothetical protein
VIGGSVGTFEIAVGLTQVSQKIGAINLCRPKFLQTWFN